MTLSWIINKDVFKKSARTDISSISISARPPAYAVAPAVIYGQWFWFRSILHMLISANKPNHRYCALRPAAAAVAEAMAAAAVVAVVAVVG